MSAYHDCLMIHGWHWMQTWRFVSSRSDASCSKQGVRSIPSPGHSLGGLPAIRFPLLPGVSFAGRLGLDLGIDTDPALGGHRRL